MTCVFFIPAPAERRLCAQEGSGESNTTVKGYSITGRLTT
jgi:hypothetical protein